MARDFNGTNAFLESGGNTLVVSALPFTIAAWVNTDVDTGRQFIVSLCNPGDGGSTDFAAIEFRGDTVEPIPTGPYDFMQATMLVGESIKGAKGTTPIAPGDGWVHVMGRFGSSFLTIYVNGVEEGTVAHSLSFPNVDRILVGARRTPGGASLRLNGQAAEVAIWNVALDTPQAKQLTAGVRPISIRADALVHYYPLLDTTSDNMGRDADLSEGGDGSTTHAADHPPMSYGFPAQIDVGPRFVLSGDGSLPLLTGTGSADLQFIAADGANDLPLLQGDGTADLQFIATDGAEDLPLLTGTGTAELVFDATDGASDLPLLTGTGSAELAFAATGGQGDLPLLSGTGAAELSFLAADGGGVLPLLQGAGTGELVFDAADGAGSLPLLTGTGAAVQGHFFIDGQGDLPLLTGTGSAELAFVGADGGGVLPLLTGTGNAVAIANSPLMGRFVAVLPTNRVVAILPDVQIAAVLPDVQAAATLPDASVAATLGDNRVTATRPTNRVVAQLEDTEPT